MSNAACSIGGESLAVAQNTYAVSWFKGKELNMVFGLQLSLARIVSKILETQSEGRCGEAYFDNWISVIMTLSARRVGASLLSTIT